VRLLAVKPTEAWLLRVGHIMIITITCTKLMNEQFTFRDPVTYGVNLKKFGKDVSSAGSVIY